MATSGVVTYSINELDIITDAMQGIGELGTDETLNNDDILLCRRKLNMIMKQWSGNTDYAPGFKMWTRKRATLFLQKDQSSYSLGPSGDHASASYVTTTLSAAAVLGASTLTVSSITGISNADNIGVLLSTGFFQWTTVNGAPSGSTVTLATTLTAAAASGARIFVYTTKMRRPLTILTAMLKGTDSQETFIDPTMILEEYQGLPDKTVEGTPDRVYYEAQLTNGVAYLNREPDDVTKVVSMVYLSPIEDTTTTTDTIDVPQEYFRPLSLQLQMDISLPFRVPIKPELKGMRDEALSIARSAYPQVDRSYFEPNADGEA
jgi:hypothetical protein